MDPADSGQTRNVSTKRRAGMPRRVAALARDVRAALHGHDPMLYAAGLTFYACIAILPIVLVSLWVGGFVVGHDSLRAVGNSLAGALPRNLGAKDIARRVIDAGTGLSWGAALASLLPSSLYGEGLRRAFDRMSRHRDRNAAQPAWRGRLLTLAFLAAGPLAVTAVFLLAIGVSTVTDGSPVLRALGWLCAFVVTWLVLTGLLALAYRAVAPERPGPRALGWGGAATGFALGAVLVGYVGFLHLPLQPGKAYGGIIGFGSLAISAAWMYAAHVVVLVGYVLTLEIDARGGRPTAQPRRPALDRRKAA
jgi:membrane protein